MTETLTLELHDGTALEFTEPTYAHSVQWHNENGNVYAVVTNHSPRICEMFPLVSIRRITLGHAA